MKKHFYKRIAAFFIAASLTLSSLTLSFTNVFAAENEAEPGIRAETLASALEAHITRGQFAMLINTAFGLYVTEGENFSDVPAEHPYAADLLCAKIIGYMGGVGDGNVDPDAALSGAEAAVIINNLLGFDPSLVEDAENLQIAKWAQPSASVLKDLNMISDELITKKQLTITEAMTFVDALSVAAMFYGSPYALTQASLNDDYYAYTNRQYLATKTITPGYMFAASFVDTDTIVQQQTSEILMEVLNNTSAAKGSDEWKINELYKMYIDNTARTESIEMLKPYFDEINAAESIDELLVLAKKYDSYFTLVPFYGVMPTSDAKVDASKYCAIILPSSLDLGSKDYYADTEVLEPIQQAYRDYMSDILEYIGETENIEERAEAIYEVEKARADKDLPQEAYVDPNILYKQTTWEDILEATKTTGALTYSDEILDILKGFNVYCPNMEYITFVEGLYKEENLRVLKDYALLNVVSTFASMLGDDFSDLSDGLMLAMLGQTGDKAPVEQRAQSFVSSMMSSTFSRMYYEKYGSAEIKNDVTEIVESIRSKYRERIASLEWMSGKTKEAAIEKLNAIKAYIAFPDEPIKEIAYDVKAKDDGGNLIDVYFSILEVANKEIIEALKKPVNDNLWESVPASTVNAYYSPTNNAIIIPLGILQEPFYDKNASREENLGAIGAVIAHEFTHAFDNSGAQYDKNGTLTNWWTDEDYESFGILTAEVSDKLSAIQFVGEYTVNGVLCTGETIADLGAMACVLDIADDVDGTDLTDVMEAWAAVWASRMSPEVAVYFLSIDSHAPNKVRVNFVLSQLEDFYEIYEITETDNMFVPEDDRINIW